MSYLSLKTHELDPLNLIHFNNIGHKNPKPLIIKSMINSILFIKYK